MYERQDGIGLEIGSYAHRSILHDPEDIPSIEEAVLSPTEFPFTQEDFDPQMEDALELMPEIVGDETVGVKYAINGLIALTPDGMPVLGEMPEVKGLWSAAAVWVKEGPAVGRCIAEWMIHGEPSIDVGQSDISRFHAHQKTRQHTKAPRLRGVPQDLRHRPPCRAVPVRPRRSAALRCTNGTSPTAPRCSRSPAGSARSGTAATRTWSRSTASGRARTSGTLAGGARSSTASTSRCAMRRASSTCRRSPSSTSSGRAPSPGCRRWRCATWTSRSARWCTRRSCRRRAASRATSRSCGSRRTCSAWSRAAPTA